MTQLTDREMIELIRILSQVEGFLIGDKTIGCDCVLEMIGSQTDLLAKKLEESKS